MVKCVLCIYLKAYLKNMPRWPQIHADVITFGASIDTVEVTILIKEAENGVKVSLRSKSLVDVSKIAEIFNGGGHIRAAGFFTEANFQDTKVKLLEILEKELIK